MNYSAASTYPFVDVSESESWLVLDDDGKSLESTETSSTFVDVNFSHLLPNSSNCTNTTSEASDFSLGWADFALVFLFVSVIAGTVVSENILLYVHVKIPTCLPI